MRKFNVLLFFSLISWASQAQFVNNGAIVIIQPGATLKVEADFINNSGTVTNEGTIEIKGDFTNALGATFDSDPGTIVRFIGDIDSEVTSHGATFALVEMAKEAKNIILQDDMTINETLTFVEDANKVVLGAHDLTVVTIASADGNEYVVTNGAGSLIKSIAADGTLSHEIGDMDHATFLNSAVTGSAYTNATLAARVSTTSLTDKIFGATDYINREWQVIASGITDYNNTLTGTYVAGDAVGTQSLITGSTYHTNDWFFNGSDKGPLEVVAFTDENQVLLSGQNKFSSVNLKVFLAGALSGSTMTKTLNTNNVIPLVTPYTAAPFNAPSVTAPSIPTAATDWILVEVRDATTPSTILSQTSGFILDNGTIVAADGSELRIKEAPATGHIAIRHRNHLSIRTPNPMDLNNPPSLYDFTTGAGQAYTDTNISSNANMRNIGGVWAMWGGNANSNANVRFSTTSGDYNYLINTPSNGVSPNIGCGGNTSYNQFPLYSNADINMDARLRFSATIGDYNALLNGALNGNTSLIIRQHL